MTITIHDHNDPTNLFKRYDVRFFNTKIQTIVTKSPNIVDGWISKMEEIHQHRPLVVGLDVEWRPNTNPNVQNPVAILQLCVGGNVLIFQIMYAPFISGWLVNFLRNPSHTFVGVGVGNDVQKLYENYGIQVGRIADLRDLAFQKFGVKELRNAGLKGLTSWVLGKEFDKPIYVTMSCWDQAWLTLDQVAYACVDAYLSFEIGRSLICGD